LRAVGLRDALSAALGLVEIALVDRRSITPLSALLCCDSATDLSCSHRATELSCSHRATDLLCCSIATEQSIAGRDSRLADRPCGSWLLVHSEAGAGEVELGLGLADAFVDDERAVTGVETVDREVGAAFA